MSKNILSVSYHPELLVTRHMLLEREGYNVTSALGFTQSIAKCSQGDFHLFILGHSIPQADKGKLIKAFRISSAGPVLSLARLGEPPVEAADYEMPMDGPAEFLTMVARILQKKSS